MASIDPVLFAQFQQFMVFTEFQKLQKESAVQNDSISSHPNPLTAKFQAVPSAAYVKPFDPAKHQNPETIPKVNNATSYNAEAIDRNVAGSGSAYRGNYGGHDWEAGAPGWRQNLKLRLDSTGNSKRTWYNSRQFVIKACMERGISLDQTFDSYGVEKMDAMIDNITELAAPRPEWDRGLVRDIIRSLCYDGIRRKDQVGKRVWEALQGDPEHELEVKRTMMDKGEKFVTGGNATTIALKNHDYHTQNYGSKTVAYGLSSRKLGIQDKNTVLTAEEMIPNVPMDSQLFAPLFRVDFQSPTRQITLYFPQNISYTTFNETIFGTHVRLSPGETLQYKARSGTHQDLKFKPLMLEEDFISMVKMYTDSGVTLHVLHTTELSDPEKDLAPPGKTTATKMSSTPPPNLYPPATDNISPSDSKSSRKSARKLEKIKNRDKKEPSHKKHRKVSSRTVKAEKEVESPEVDSEA